MTPEGDDGLVLVWPEGAEFDKQASILEREKPNLEAELGTSVRVVRSDPGRGRRWVCRVEPGLGAPPLIRSTGEVIESVGRTPDELWSTFSLRHTWLRLGAGEVRADAATDLDEAAARIADEVGFSFPGFALRSIDWPRICADHWPRVLAAEDPLAACQEWVAMLQDGHTAVHPEPRPVPLPYVSAVRGRTARLLRVPEGTPAWDAGIRPGWLLSVGDAGAVARRTAAPPHLHPFASGRRLLSFPAGKPVVLEASAPDGRRVTWSERPTPEGFGDLVSWRRLPSGVAYVVVRHWKAGAGVEEALDAALAELARCSGLVLDLRGNVGGNHLLALSARDRFLRTETTLGTVRYSIGRGLSEPVPIIGTPAPAARRWPGRLVVLTDPLTYSASEDFLLGLAGLEHVRVVGERSGGGSGRPRTVQLLPGWQLTISTALTYDRSGHCVEGAGIPVDVEVPAFDTAPHDRILATAEALIG